VGNSAIELGLAALATGPVEEVWFTENGSQLLVRTASGLLFETSDFEQWRAVSDDESGPRAFVEPVPPDAVAPETGATLFAVRDQPAVFYALGRAVYRSEDGGFSWMDLTRYRGFSILGEGLKSMAVAPDDGDQIVVAGRFGVWRSLDGGLSWDGLNEGLPNLPANRLLQLPAGGQPTRVSAEGVVALEWAPGERISWRPVADYGLQQEERFRAALSESFGDEISAAARLGDYVYAGSASGGVLWVSADSGRSWRTSQVASAGTIERIFPVPGAVGVAVAAAGGTGENAARVLRTVNGGIFWDDITGDLPDAAVTGITAYLESGSVYVATKDGAYLAATDLRRAGPPEHWSLVTENLPRRSALDVALDDGGNQIYVLLDGEGVFAAIAPHRYLDPNLVSGADWTRRAAAPGALLSILGRQVVMARIGALEVPVLAASESESQIQVPFEAAGTALSLALRDSDSAERYSLGIPLDSASPAIFVDTDGTPLLLDADTGVMLDALRAARPGSRVQILATGLGRVEPEWPTGLPAPLEDPPEVVSQVRAVLDGAPVEVTKATLAAGYIGFYVVEFRVPDIVNAGPSELFLEVDGNSSNHARIYLEP